MLSLVEFVVGCRDLTTKRALFVDFRVCWSRKFEAPMHNRPTSVVHF